VPPVPPGFREATFTSGEVPIHYVEGPRSGHDLVLLHGMARDWHSFVSLIPELSARFHLFVIDLRGHGMSGRSPRGYTIPQFSNDVAAFITAHAPHGATIFGHSLGAMVGMQAAGCGKCNVTALIVGDSMISPENLARSPYHSLFSQLIKLIERGGSQQDLTRGIGKIEILLPGIDEALRLEELAGNTPTVLAEWARSAHLADPEALAMSLDGSAFTGWAPQTILPRISCRVQLLQANPQLDALLSDADVQLALKLLPRAEHVKFPLLGHALFLQKPEPVLKEILRFLDHAK